MSNEITLTGSLSVYKSTIMQSAIGRSFTDILATMTGNLFSFGSVSVGTAAEAIPLGEVTSPGWCFFFNHDATNYLNIRNGASGADVAELLAGEPALFRFKRTGVPYAIANTAAVILEYLILSL